MILLFDFNRIVINKMQAKVYQHTKCKIVFFHQLIGW